VAGKTDEVTETVGAVDEVLEEASARGTGTDPELARAAEDDLHPHRPVNERSGETLRENKLQGDVTEARQAEEVVAGPPRRPSRIFKRPRIAQDHIASFESGAITLREFAEAFGPYGARQVYIGRYGRQFDHIYLDGSRVVFRESKKSKLFRQTPRHRQQIEKDLVVLRDHADAVVEWRISGPIDAESRAVLDGLVADYPGRFRYRLD
jgi:hypothetical protein